MTAEDDPLRRLEALLGHGFRDPGLLREALTHASRAEGHNERLEFLGDAVLDLVVAESLYRRFAGAREGRLTQWKSLLVSRETLARVGERLGLAAFLQVGSGLDRQRSLPRSLAGNAVEALLGALYLDLGGARGGALETCRRVAEEWLAPEMADLPRRADRAHAKTLLQDWAQARVGAIPRYELVEVHEHPETRSFRVRARVGARDFPPAWGTSKRQAERRAAWEAVLVLRSEGETLGLPVPEPASPTPSGGADGGAEGSR